MPILDLNQMKVETKWQRLKRKVKERKDAAFNYIRDHPEAVGMAATGAAAVIGGATKICKSLVRTHNLQKERYNKERYIYDRSLCMYLHTKRKLTNKDYAVINLRRKKGEKLSDILMNMKILD